MRFYTKQLLNKKAKKGKDFSLRGSFTLDSGRPYKCLVSSHRDFQTILVFLETA